MATVRRLLPLFVLLAMLQHAFAQVESKVPPGQNEETWKFCGSLGQVLFEGLPEGSVLGEAIPGVKFTTTAGQDWLVGTWSSGKYNGKYPSGAYTSEGDAWAWLGPSQGAGVITFTNGPASYFSCFTSTIGGVTVDAYDQNDNFLATSGFASNNIGTGTMDKLTISRPRSDMRSVRIHDSGNYWLIDAICTDAPGVNCGSLKVPDYKQYSCGASPPQGATCGTWATEAYDNDPPSQTWQPSMAEVLGALILDPNGLAQKVSAVTGDALTGSSPPAWNTSVGGATADNHVTWTNQGAQHNTISAEGCDLTSLVDIIRSYGVTTAVDGKDVNPSNMNEWLNDPTNSGWDYDNNGVVSQVRPEIVDTYTGNKVQYVSEGVSMCAAAPNTYVSVVDQDVLGQQRPVMLRVPYWTDANHTNTETCGHWVVATGRCNTTYTIRDPGRSKDDLLQDPYKGKFYNYRRYKPGAGTPVPIVVINMHSPADVLVTSPDGKRTGFDAATGEFLSEIPQSGYSDEGGIVAEDGSGKVTSKYRRLQISQPVGGQYQILLSGTDTGSYRMEVRTRDASDLYDVQNVLGTIVAGSTQQFSLQYSPTQAGTAGITSPGRLVGNGNFGSAAILANVSSTGTSAVGTVTFTPAATTANRGAPGIRLIKSTSIRTATFQPGIANVNGSCMVNGQSGYSFVLSVLGGTPTQVALQVKDDKGNVVYNVSGALQGKLQISNTP